MMIIYGNCNVLYNVLIKQEVDPPNSGMQGVEEILDQISNSSDPHSTTKNQIKYLLCQIGQQIYMIIKIKTIIQTQH